MFLYLIQVLVLSSGNFTHTMALKIKFMKFKLINISLN
jgi:hypothetical protein